MGIVPYKPLNVLWLQKLFFFILNAVGERTPVPFPNIHTLFLAAPLHIWGNETLFGSFHISPGPTTITNNNYIPYKRIKNE
jgi:hypothetical protein